MSTTHNLVTTSEETPLDRPWLAHYPACVDARLNYPQIPAWGLLEQTARKYPAETACRYYRQTLTFAEIDEAARKLAAVLVRHGVKPGDRVALMLPNVPEYVIALNGIWRAGAIPVAMSPLMVREEVSALMQATDSRHVIALDLLAPLVLHGDYQPEHVFFTTLKDRLPGWQRLGYAFAKIRRLGFWPAADGANQHDFNDELKTEDGSFTSVPLASLDEPAYILPTGGTTGAPKAVTLSHRNLISNAWQLYHWAGARENRESILAVLPFFHSYGLTTCVMTGTALAAPLIMHHRFIPRMVVKLIETHRPTIFPTVPAMLSALNPLLQEAGVRSDSCSLRYCLSGGAPLPANVGDEFARLTGAQVVEGFGLSECSPVALTGPLDGSNRPGTIGLPLPDTDVRLVDTETGLRDVPVGEVGELIVRGPQVMLGYWNQPDATDQVIRDGWLYTGDLATRDADGFFRIVDRKKDLIITSGFNVYPTDVEHVLRGFAGVQDLAIVGVPDEERGELVKAMIVMQPGYEFDRAAFQRYAAAHLSKHKRPHLFEVIEGDLPRNFLGKVLRRHLREALSEAPA